MKAEFDNLQATRDQQTRVDAVIDGSLGEGGGQIFRTSLTLAMCLGKSVCIEKIRAGRKKPGLLRQHLTCLRAAQEICNASVVGAELGASTVTFAPGKIRAGKYHFEVGSAGSTTLVFQTVLMPLLLADGESELTLEGGTHNGMAPSFDYIQHCFLPVMAALNCRIDVKLERYGFYPAGGGAWLARIYPTRGIRALTLVDKGEQVAQLAVATSSRIPEHVTERELNQVRRQCLWPEESLQQRLVHSVGPGNIVSLRLTAEKVNEVCEAIGERNVSAERVAGRAIRDIKRYLHAGVPVGRYLADQLVLPLALGKGGVFTTLQPSRHLLTNIAVIEALTAAEIELAELNEDIWQVLVHKNHGQD